MSERISTAISRTFHFMGLSKGRTYHVEATVVLEGFTYRAQRDVLAAEGRAGGA